jgi:hypothetical protein
MRLSIYVYMCFERCIQCYSFIFKKPKHKKQTKKNQRDVGFVSSLEVEVEHLCGG